MRVGGTTTLFDQMLHNDQMFQTHDLEDRGESVLLIISEMREQVDHLSDLLMLVFHALLSIATNILVDLHELNAMNQGVHLGKEGEIWYLVDGTQIDPILHEVDDKVFEVYDLIIIKIAGCE